jgi:peptide/nickel transport system substrate-binding protein
MRVVDPSTLEVRLATPNAHFDRAIERQSFNYVPSAQAVAAGHDFTSKPVGAGPFVLDEWLRDSHMSMSPNPDWVGSDGPYVDKYTLRILPDELQRSNAFVAGEGDLTIVNSVADVIEAGKDAGATWNYVTTPTSPAFTFNTQKPPFNDVRVRRAFVLGVEHQAMAEAAGATTPAETWTYEDSPWYVPEATIPQYDPDEAQALFNEVAAELGGPVKIIVGSSQGSLDLARNKFVQTSLNQLDNVEVEVEVLDGASRIGKVLSRDYQVSSWGFPWMDPEPNLYNYAHTGSFSNYAGYSNPEVDAALEAARVTRDFDERKELYSKVIRQMADDVVWFPTIVSEAGFLAAADVQGVVMYHEYVLRPDLLWRSN